MIHIIGFFSGLLLIAGFYLLSNKKLDSQSYAYQGMTFLGAFGIGLECFFNNAWGSVFLQTTSCIIAASVILRRLFKKD